MANLVKAVILGGKFEQQGNISRIGFEQCVVVLARRMCQRLDPIPTLHLNVLEDDIHRLFILQGRALSLQLRVLGLK
jgi:hypothetical protein